MKQLATLTCWLALSVASTVACGGEVIDDDRPGAAPSPSGDVAPGDAASGGVQVERVLAMPRCGETACPDDQPILSGATLHLHVHGPADRYTVRAVDGAVASIIRETWRCETRPCFADVKIAAGASGDTELEVIASGGNVAHRIPFRVRSAATITAQTSIAPIDDPGLVLGEPVAPSADGSFAVPRGRIANVAPIPRDADGAVLLGSWGGFDVDVRDGELVAPTPKTFFSPARVAVNEDVVTVTFRAGAVSAEVELRAVD